MRNVIFVAPFLLETTLRFIKASCALSGVRVGLITQDASERIPEELRAKLAAHQRAEDALDPKQIAGACRSLSRRLGPVHRLLGALEELQVPLAEARAELGIAGLDPETARNFRDKARMKELLHRAGLPCARHRRVSTTADAEAFARDVGFPLIIKPTAGSGSRDTMRVENGDQLRDGMDWCLRSGSPLMLEEFVRGEEHSFDSVCLRGRVVWYSINHYFPSPLQVLENPWIQWCVLLPREVEGPAYASIRGAAEGALRVLGMESGLSHLEWFRRDDGSIAISEVGARPPGAQFTTLMSYAHDIDFYRAWARLIIFEDFEPPGRPYAAGAAFLRGQGTGRVKAIRGLEEAQREIGRIIVEVKLPKKGQTPSGTYDGDGYVIVRHPETRVVKKALQHLVRVIRVDLG